MRGKRPGTIDRAAGALLGLAIGDAVGTTLEFSSRDTAPRVTDMVGEGPFGLESGQWTDDTAMALALGESLVERGWFDAEVRLDSGWDEPHEAGTEEK